MGKTVTDATTWLEYFHAASEAAGYVGRGWQAKLARDIGASDSDVSKWSKGERLPSVDSCRQLARVWRRPFIREVLVRAGHLEAAEVGQRDTPPRPTGPKLTPEMQRLAALLDRPDLPADVRGTIEAMIASVVDLGELSSSTERRTG